MNENKPTWTDPGIVMSERLPVEVGAARRKKSKKSKRAGHIFH